MKLSAMRAKHDQRQSDASEKLFRCPPKFSAAMSKSDKEAMEIFGKDEILMSWLLHYARLGHSATCIAVIERVEMEQQE